MDFSILIYEFHVLYICSPSDFHIVLAYSYCIQNFNKLWTMVSQLIIC